MGADETAASPLEDDDSSPATALVLAEMERLDAASGV
jgi:hypothetical protein